MAEPRNRYSTVSLVLHWLIAALVVTQVGLVAAHEWTDGPISREFVQTHGQGIPAAAISDRILTTCSSRPQSWAEITPPGLWPQGIYSFSTGA